MLIYVNGYRYDFPLLHGQSAINLVKKAVKAHGVEWKTCQISVPDFPKEGEYLTKRAGCNLLIKRGGK